MRRGGVCARTWYCREALPFASTTLSARWKRAAFVQFSPMSSHSPHRSRKAQMFQSNSPPRDMSPSPRQAQRTVKAQSLPIVPSVMQVFNPRPAQQSPPNVRRSTTPPPPPRDNDYAHPSPSLPPPPPTHAHSQPNIHASATMGYPRPINRFAPQFLASFHAMEENWQMTDKLMAEIERADYEQALTQQPPAPGTSGVAYAGGAQSGAVYVREAPSPHKDTVLDRVPLPKDADQIPRRPAPRDTQPTDSAQPRNRPLPASPGNSPSYSPQGHPQTRASPDRLSPPYHTPQGSSGESATAGDYVSLKRDSFQSSAARIPTPPASRKSSNATSDNTRGTPPAATKLASQTPPLQAIKTRTPDKSLPVQEEPEDDVAASLKDDIQYDHSANPPREDDDDTLIETETGYIRPADDNDHDGDSASYTPRSPSVTLPESYPTRHYPSSLPNSRLASLTKHHRNGSTDQLGLRSVDAVVNSKPPRPSEDSRESLALRVRSTLMAPQRKHSDINKAVRSTTTGTTAIPVLQTNPRITNIPGHIHFRPKSFGKTNTTTILPPHTCKCISSPRGPMPLYRLHLTVKLPHRRHHHLCRASNPVLRLLSGHLIHTPSPTSVATSPIYMPCLLPRPTMIQTTRQSLKSNSLSRCKCMRSITMPS